MIFKPVPQKPIGRPKFKQVGKYYVSVIVPRNHPLSRTSSHNQHRGYVMKESNDDPTMFSVFEIRYKGVRKFKQTRIRMCHALESEGKPIKVRPDESLLDVIRREWKNKMRRIRRSTQ